MSNRHDWHALRERRMTEPGATEAYDAAQLAFELGDTVPTYPSSNASPEPSTCTSPCSSPPKTTAV